MSNSAFRKHLNGPSRATAWEADYADQSIRVIVYSDGDVSISCWDGAATETSVLLMKEEADAMANAILSCIGNAEKGRL